MKLEWGCELIDLEKRFFIDHFFSEADYNRVLEGGPWIILGHYLTMTKWKPNFQPSLAKISSTLVWILLPKVPLEYFREKTLIRIDATFGCVVKVDHTAIIPSRGWYAPSCVELDLSQSLIPSAYIARVSTAMEYEGLHQICFSGANTSIERRIVAV